MADNKDNAPQKISDEAISEMVEKIDDAMAEYAKFAQQFDDRIFR